MATHLTILFIFSQNQLSSFIDLLFVFVSISFVFMLIFISLLLLILDIVCSSFLVPVSAGLDHLFEAFLVSSDRPVSLRTLS